MDIAGGDGPWRSDPDHRFGRLDAADIGTETNPDTDLEKIRHLGARGMQHRPQVPRSYQAFRSSTQKAHRASQEVKTTVSEHHEEQLMKNLLWKPSFPSPTADRARRIK